MNVQLMNFHTDMTDLNISIIRKIINNSFKRIPKTFLITDTPVENYI